MYAIAFDMDTKSLQDAYPKTSWQNAYNDIRSTLIGHGFEPQQGSVYFGVDESIDAVACVLAAMDLASTYPWFAPSVRDIRMLRIEEANDLMAAVERAAAT